MEGCEDCVYSVLTQERWLEESLRSAEPLITDGDDLPIRKLIGLLCRAGRGGRAHLLLVLQTTVTQLLLDVTHDLKFSCEKKAYLKFNCKTNQAYFLTSCLTFNERE